MTKVFVTDARYKHTLGAIRSLGKEKFYIIAGSSHRKSQCFYSKFCRERVLYPDPSNENKFVQFMLDYVQKHHMDSLLPIGYTTTDIISKYKKEFSAFIKVPVADYKKMKIAGNKDQTMSFAEQIGISIPKTYKTPDEIDTFPVVVKGIRESGHVLYVNSLEELTRVDLSGTIVQEYIPGDGYGFYSLFNRGTCRAFFMHRRLKEYPITGGPSVVAESVYDETLKELGLRLLNKLKWHGVAMVEFKKDRRDGTFKLMEVNPKFWGSLGLSIASGVNFPYLTIKMALDGDIEPVTRYTLGVRYRWIFPYGILHLMAQPRSIKDFIIDSFKPNTFGNIWLSDIKPNIFQFMETIPAITSRIQHNKLKYPHGRPMIQA
jgi:predicted ATP-grasp superfamily ATP-dependent carboligase